MTLLLFYYFDFVIRLKEKKKKKKKETLRTRDCEVFTNDMLESFSSKIELLHINESINYVSQVLNSRKHNYITYENIETHLPF